MTKLKEAVEVQRYNLCVLSLVGSISTREMSNFSSPQSANKTKRSFKFRHLKCNLKKWQKIRETEQRVLTLGFISLACCMRDIA